MKKTLLLSLLVVALSIPSVSAAASSQPQQRTVVTPSSVDVALAPGESTTKELTVVNKGTAGSVLKISAAPYSIRNESLEPTYEVFPGTPDVTRWVVVTTPQTESTPIAPEAVQKISYTVSIPSDTPPGGYLLAIFITTTPDTIPESVTTHNRIAAINYITVKGEVESGGEATALPFGHFSWNGALRTEFIVNNSSSMYFTATATTTVMNLWGHQIGKVEDQRRILPSTQKQITLDWQSPHPAGIYKIERSVQYIDHTERFPTKWLVVVHPLILAGILLLASGYGVFIAKQRHDRHPAV